MEREVRRQLRLRVSQEGDRGQGDGGREKAGGRTHHRRRLTRSVPYRHITV